MRPFVVKLTCCGRDDGEFRAATWEEADAFRTSYLAAMEHSRRAIVVRDEWSVVQIEPEWRPADRSDG
jgi:hypothetical protein